jgi:hypothetical protein
MNTNDIKINELETISPIVQMALSKDIDTDKLEKLIELQERHEKKQAEKEFFKSFANFKKKPLSITKKSKVSFQSAKGKTEYNYTSLVDIIDAVGPELALNGLSITWVPEQSQNSVKVTAKLTHINGHTVTATLTSPPDTSGGKNGVQGIGSTITYLARYLITALLGISTKEDDTDGAQPTAKEDLITLVQLEELQKVIKNNNRETEELTSAICAVHKIDELSKIKQSEFQNVLHRASK